MEGPQTSYILCIVCIRLSRLAWKNGVDFTECQDNKLLDCSWHFDIILAPLLGILNFLNHNYGVRCNFISRITLNVQSCLLTNKISSFLSYFGHFEKHRVQNLIKFSITYIPLMDNMALLKLDSDQLILQNSD